MRNFFSIIIIFAVLLVGGGWVYMRQADQKTKEKLADDLSSARRTFAQKARSAATENDTDAYLRSMRVALETYKEELKKHVYGGHEQLRDPEAYKKTVDQKFEKKEIDEAKRKSMLEGYELVKDAYDTLMAGNWRPVLSQKGSADTRLDLYTLKTISDQDGKPILEGKFFFWGIEDTTNVRWGNLSTRIWTTEMGKVKEGGKMVEKEVEKVLGKTEGDSQPHIIIQTPARYVDEFPAYVSVGYLWLTRPLPADAKYIDIDYQYSTKVSGGGEVLSTLKWEKMEIPADWKLKPGQVWDADVVEATEDEIAGKDAAEAEAEKEKEKKK